MSPPEREADEEIDDDRPAGWFGRLKLGIVALAGYVSILLLGKTVRWRVEGWENHRAILRADKRIIYTFWHGRIFLATYFWRDRGIVVMTSRNRDGDYIARVIRRFGYGAARGSSSRGGGRALVEMMRDLRRGRDVAFTIDGPRGPRYLAKPGAVWIASRTGHAVLPFHISAERKWVFRSSWDHFQIPKPFTRALVLMGRPIYVRTGADEGGVEEAQKRLQEALDDLRERGDDSWARRKAP